MDKEPKIKDLKLLIDGVVKIHEEVLQKSYSSMNSFKNYANSERNNISKTYLKLIYSFLSEDDKIYLKETLKKIESDLEFKMLENESKKTREKTSFLD